MIQKLNNATSLFEKKFVFQNRQSKNEIENSYLKNLFCDTSGL